MCGHTAQAPTDPGVYGIIQSGDHKGRTCAVKWIKLNASSDDVEVSLLGIVGRASVAGGTTTFLFIYSINGSIEVEFGQI